MVDLTDVVFGDVVEIIGIEPVRFADQSQVLESILAGNHPLIGKKGIVDKVDELNQIIWILVDGQRIWFNLWDLKKVGAT